LFVGLVSVALASNIQILLVDVAPSQLCWRAFDDEVDTEPIFRQELPSDMLWKLTNPKSNTAYYPVRLQPASATSFHFLVYPKTWTSESLPDVACTGDGTIQSKSFPQ